MRRIYGPKLSATGWMRAQLLRSRLETMTAQDVFLLIKSAEELEKENIMIAYSAGAEDVIYAEMYGHERRFSPQYYRETYKGGEHDAA